VSPSRGQKVGRFIHTTGMRARRDGHFAQGSSWARFGSCKPLAHPANLGDVSQDGGVDERERKVGHVQDVDQPRERHARGSRASRQSPPECHLALVDEGLHRAPRAYGAEGVEIEEAEPMDEDWVAIAADLVVSVCAASTEREHVRRPVASACVACVVGRPWPEGKALGLAPGEVLAQELVRLLGAAVSKTPPPLELSLAPASTSSTPHELGRLGREGRGWQ
jgi:hypothetical protein